MRPSATATPVPITGEIVFAQYEEKQEHIKDIERATGLRFPELSEVDTAG